MFVVENLDGYTADVPARREAIFMICTGKYLLNAAVHTAGKRNEKRKQNWGRQPHTNEESKGVGKTVRKILAKIDMGRGK